MRCVINLNKRNFQAIFTQVPLLSLKESIKYIKVELLTYITAYA